MKFLCKLARFCQANGQENIPAFSKDMIVGGKLLRTFIIVYFNNNSLDILVKYAEKERQGEQGS